MGPTGSGKTTLIQLLARCYDVTSGSISVDGCNVRKWKLQQLRDGIGTATQDVFLFPTRWKATLLSATKR